MATTSKTRGKRSVEDKRAEVDSLKEAFSDWEEDQDETSLATIIAMHDGYSDRNALLIGMQSPTATDVRGYKAWLDQGRQVRKGEHGIRILAPKGHKDERKNEKGETTEKGRQFFGLISVFDITQTDPIEVK